MFCFVVCVMVLLEGMYNGLHSKPGAVDFKFGGTTGRETVVQGGRLVGGCLGEPMSGASQAPGSSL